MVSGGTRWFCHTFSLSVSEHHCLRCGLLFTHYCVLSGALLRRELPPLVTGIVAISSRIVVHGLEQNRLEQKRMKEIFSLEEIHASVALLLTPLACWSIKNFMPWSLTAFGSTLEVCSWLEICGMNVEDEKTCHPVWVLSSCHSNSDTPRKQLTPNLKPQFSTRTLRFPHAPSPPPGEVDRRRMLESPFHGQQCLPYRLSVCSSLSASHRQFAELKTQRAGAAACSSTSASATVVAKK